jgi:hypothetical protein
MSRRVLFLFLFLTVLPAPLQAAKNITVPAAPTVSNNVPIDDIEPPVPLTEQKHDWLRPALAAALLAVIILLILLKRKKQPQQQAALSPDEAAWLALSQAEPLIADSKCAAFAALFDQTLRTYLETGLGITALQQTASELIRLLEAEHQKLPKALQSYRKELENWLRCCEAGKFAEATLSQEEMTEMTTQLRAFVEAAEARAQGDEHGQLSLR